MLCLSAFFPSPDLKLWILSVYETSKSEAAGKSHASLDNPGGERQYAKEVAPFWTLPGREGEEAVAVYRSP